MSRADALRRATFIEGVSPRRRPAKSPDAAPVGVADADDGMTPWNIARKVFPFIDQSRGYNLKVFGEDFLSGTSIAFVLLPQAIAYSKLAELEPLNALGCAIFPTIIYFMFGASRQLSTGPEAIVSVITGVTILMENAKNPDSGFSAVQIATTFAFVTGIMTAGIALMKAGFIDNILSGFLLCGFITGVAFLIISEQMPEMFGLTVKLPGEGSTLDKFIVAFKAFNTFQVAPFLITLSNVAFLFGMRKLKKTYGHMSIWLKRAPEILLLVMFMIIFSFALDFKGKGIRVLGAFDNQFKAPKLPYLDPGLMGRLIQPAVTAILVGYVECQTTTRVFGLKNGYFPDANQELFTFGLMNIFLSFIGGYPTFGSLTRSRLLANAGAKTTVANLVSSVIVFIATLVMVPALQFLPKATLASIVFVAALGLIEIHEIVFVFKCRSWMEIAMFILTTIITFLTDVSVGILICLGLSALLICKRSTSSSLSVVGRIPNPANPTIKTYADIDEHPEAELMEGLIIVRFNESMLFYNCGMARRSMESLMMAESRIVMQRMQDAAKYGYSFENTNKRASADRGLNPDDVNNYQSYSDTIGLYDDEDDFTRVAVNRNVARRRSEMRGGVDANGYPRENRLSTRYSRFSMMGNNRRASSNPLDANRFNNDTPYGAEKFESKGDKDVESLFDENNQGLHTVIIDFSRCLELDSAACYILKKIIHQFQKQGLLVHMVGVSEEQKGLFHRSGVEKLLAGCIFDTLEESVANVESGLDRVRWTRDI
ncbi:Solute carrier 26 [Chytridiales sp. JEL 0842]|nr:Solute carrier 26 [Chytridiales sp. JEL 0842]